MAEILHDLPIGVSPARVFAAFSTPDGLDTWWTLRSAGEAKPGGEYLLDFGPGYEWRARVTRCVPGREFELEFTHAAVHAETLAQVAPGATHSHGSHGQMT